MCLIFEKVIYTYFYLLLLENNEFFQFYLQKYLDLFSFKKIDLYKIILKNIVLFAKYFLIKKRALFIKMLKFNQILLKKLISTTLICTNNSHPILIEKII